MLLQHEKTERIIRSFYKVYNELGYGFLEKVYENALFKELRMEGFECRQQVPVDVYYRGEIVGSYFSDILVDNLIILELKSLENDIILDHELQLQNYLKATKLELGLLLNFGKKPSFKRKIFSNIYK